MSKTLAIVVMATFLCPAPAWVLAMPPRSAQPGRLTIVVIAGEDGVNVIQQRTAVVPIVEVRDRNDVPVAGVPVTFSVGQGASFGGQQTMTVVSNAAGRATASGLSPSSAGPIQIQVTAVHQGQTAAATISQTNFATVQAAAQAGATVAGGGGGGMSAVMIGILAAAAGGGAIVAAKGAGDASSASPAAAPAPTTPGTPTTTAPPTPPAPPANRAPIINAASANPGIALVGTDTRISFQVEASDPDGDPLTFLWEFPDGATSTEASPSRTFQHGGATVVRVTVRDAQSSATREVTVTMKTITGIWFPGPGARIDTWTLTQSGSSIHGTLTRVLTNAFGDCPMTGSVRPTPPQVIVEFAECRASTGFFPGTRYEFNPSADADTLTGTGHQTRPEVRVFPSNAVRQR